MTRMSIDGFEGELIQPGHPGYDGHRAVWNAIVDRRPALIARCTSATDVAAAIRFARAADLEIAVKCGGHGILGLAVPEGGIQLDLTPMGSVRVDPEQRRAYVGGGALLGTMDLATEPFGLATTAGNISHTGVGGLTLGGGMGWLARQFGMACDNVAAYTIVTADGEVLRASATDHPDLYWGLRGGGGNFGVVTEFQFRLHPISHRALVVDLLFDAADAVTTLQRWRELLPDAPRQATLDSGVTTATEAHGLPPHMVGRPIAMVGFGWIGDMDGARAWLPAIRSVGTPLAERVQEMSYVQLQTAVDEKSRHGMRRYNKGHYLTELSDGAIEAYLSRGVASGALADWSSLPNGGFQSYGGAIGDIPDEDAAFSQRDALLEWGDGSSWLDPAEDAARIAASRAYRPAKLAKLAALKARYDPDNVFHLNQNIAPA